MSPDLLSLSVAIFGRYDFTPADVTSITPYGWIPIAGRGVKINHTRTAYPAHIVFWYLGSPHTVIRRISEAGFVPSAEPHEGKSARHFPARISVLAVLALVWNACFLLDFATSSTSSARPGWASWIAIALLFVVSAAVSSSPRAQQLVLRDGHSFDEIRAYVRLIRLISAIMLLALLPTLLSA